ncbi:calcium-translocating P-type ATPase [Cadophora sp. DSE1049]|nr:calcium-translocating P-type ATPase [Cadophora sp. DSE1049]
MASNTDMNNQGEKMGSEKSPLSQPMNPLQFEKVPTFTKNILKISSTHDPIELTDNKFAFLPDQISKLIDPKSLSAFYALGGIDGLERGLRADRRSGLSSDETYLDEMISLEEPKIAHATGKPLPQQSKDYQVPRLPTCSNVPGHSFADRRRIFGENRLPEKASKSLLQLAWLAYNDRVLILLSIAAVISLGVGLYQTFGQPHKEGEAKVEWIEGVAITVAILIVVVVGALNDWQKERQFAKLNQKKQDRVIKVIRSGKTQEICVFDVLVGDIVRLEPGDMVPVDGVLIDGYNIRCDESSATGESNLVKKHSGASVFKAIEEGEDLAKMDPFILSGSKVSEGVGTFLVIAVGIHSSYGKVLISLHEGPEVTPLQLKLNRLANQIAKIGSASALLLLVTLLIKFLAQLKENQLDSSGKAQQFLQILIVTITVIVVAVPEGLPLAVTLALAFATTKMLKDNNLVRYLKACETMGNATTICSDKTGTLTQNVMTVVAISICQDMDEGSEDAAFSPSESIQLISQPIKTLLKDSIAINSTAFEVQDKGYLAFVGSKTDTALLDFAHASLAMGAVNTERSNCNTVYLVPFDSGRKYMATVVRTDNCFRIYAKGAAEVMLKRCTRIIQNAAIDDSTSTITPETMAHLSRTIEKYATRSLRTIGLLYRDIDELPTHKGETIEEYLQHGFEDLFNDMTLLAIVGIQDPLRKGVKESVQRCQKAGITVRMVTGDNLITAKAIAKECGILMEDGLVMEGHDFRHLGAVEMSSVIPRLQVLARSSPEDKKTLVKALQETGAVVAVTGDGTNDAPALKMADVGFSMGLAGTEVAKEASDIVLMDDNFTSIVKAVMWGRAVNDAVRKFLQFQITVNIAAVVLTFISSVASNTETSVLTAVQLLWVNLIMDTMGALALATDPPTESILDRKPDPRSSPLITVTMWKMIIGQSIYKLVILLIMHFGGEAIFSYSSDQEKKQLRTMVFNTFVWMQIFNQYNNRRIDNKLNIFEGITRNWLFVAINLSMIVGQVIIVLVGGRALQVVHLTGAQWGYSIVLGFFSIPIAVLIRYFPDEWFRKIIPGRWLATNPVPVQVTDWDFVLEEIREEMKFISWVHGGRLHKWRRRGRITGKGGLKPVAAMAGLVAGSIGGWPRGR